MTMNIIDVFNKNVNTAEENTLPSSFTLVL